MAQTYEGMFLLDNEIVRQDWSRAKSVVTDVLVKNGATVKAARRWDERRLAYPVKHKNRASYLLAYYEIPGDQIPLLIRDLDLSEPVLRYLLTRAAEVPASELELAAAEEAPDFLVPEPPADEVGDYMPIQNTGDDDDEDDDEGGMDLDLEDDIPRVRRTRPPAVMAVASSKSSGADTEEPEEGEEA